MRKPKHPERPIAPQAQMICNAWIEIMGARLSPALVTEHLEMLAEAQSKCPCRECKRKGMKPLKISPALVAGAFIDVDGEWVSVVKQR
jgi:hypothetical protein